MLVSAYADMWLTRHPNYALPGIGLHHLEATVQLGRVESFLCLPALKFWTIYSDVRNERARIESVVVLSVQFRKTLASHT